MNEFVEKFLLSLVDNKQYGGIGSNIVMHRFMENLWRIPLFSNLAHVRIPPQITGQQNAQIRMLLDSSRGLIIKKIDLTNPTGDLLRKTNILYQLEGLKSIGHLSANRPNLSRSRCKDKMSSWKVILWYNKASSANNLWVHSRSCCVSLINSRNINRPSTVPWGTPEVTSTDFEHSPSIMTLRVLLVSQDLIHISVLPWIP